MKTFLKIVSIGFLGFMVIAMIQEHEVFLAALPGRAEEPVVGPPQGDRTEAVEALRFYLTMLEHLYASDGDPRFAERIPASPSVVDEIMSEVAYLRRNQRRQEMKLMDLQVEDVEIRADQALLQVREFWVVRTVSLVDGADTDPPQSTVLNLEYYMVRDDAAWQVVGWALAADQPSETAVRFAQVISTASRMQRRGEFEGGGAPPHENR